MLSGMFILDFSLRIIDRYERSFNDSFIDDFSDKLIVQIFSIGLSAVALLLFIVPNLELLASGGREDFSSPLIHYLSELIVFSAILIFVGFIVFKLLKRYYRFWLTMIVVVSSLYCVVNIFMFPANYGEMSSFIFQSTIIIPGYITFLNILSLIAVIAFIGYAVKKRKTALIKNLMVILLISLIGLSANNVRVFSTKRHNFSAGDSKDFRKSFHFSKTGKNVVILMLDRFIGGYVQEALDMDPSLKVKYDGFTWYRKSLSCSSQTIGGLPAILGGYDYDITEMHNKRLNIPLMQRIFESGKVLPYNFNRAGFHSTLLSPTAWCFDEKDKRYMDNTSVENINGNNFCSIIYSFTKYR